MIYNTNLIKWYFKNVLNTESILINRLSPQKNMIFKKKLKT